MATYEITAELNLKNIIAESREVAQALNEFADNLERIEKKYAEPQEIEEKSCSNCKFWGLDKDDKSRRCRYCYHQDEWQEESEGSGDEE